MKDLKKPKPRNQNQLSLNFHFERRKVMTAPPPRLVKGHLRIGTILENMGRITPNQLIEVIEQQRIRPNERLGKIAVNMGYTTSEYIITALAEQWHLPVINLDKVLKIPKKILKLITPKLAREIKAIPFEEEEDGIISVAVMEPSPDLPQQLRKILGKEEIRCMLTTPEAMERALDRFYEQKGGCFGLVFN